MSTVLVAGWVGSSNLGDELVFAALRNKLTQRDVEVCAMSMDPKATRSGHTVRAIDHRRVDRIVAAMRAADAVIVGGGGLLQDETSPFNLPYHLLRPIVGRVLRRPVGAIGLGAGPVDTRLGRGLVRHGLRGVAPVTVRDDESRQVLQHLGIAARTTADLAFGLPVPVAGPADRLVVCLRPWSPARRLMPVGSRRVDPTPPWFVPAAARALDSAADALGLPVHFVALQADRDHPLHEAIARTMRTPATLASPGVHDVVDEVARGAVVVSMRYHGIVAATLAGRPSVAVGYSPKVDALAHDIGRAARALPWSGEGIAAIPDALRAIAANGADALEARERLRARERGNDDAIDDLLRR